jgi:hypothetical protein
MLKKKQNTQATNKERQWTNECAVIALPVVSRMCLQHPITRTRSGLTPIRKGNTTVGYKCQDPSGNARLSPRQLIYVDNMNR